MYHKIQSEIVVPDMILYTDIVYSNQFNLYMQKSIPLKLHIIRPFYEIRNWERLPLIIWIGGGAFKNSTPGRNIPEMVEFAKRGYVVASIGYRVSSEDFFPAPLQDIKASIRFLRSHGETYGIDPERIAVCGHSAGAYLSVMAAVTGETEVFDTSEWAGVSSAVKGAVCISGGELFSAFEEEGDGREHRAEITKQVLGYAPIENPERAKQALPSAYIGAQTPPILIIHGSEDNTVPIHAGIKLYKALEESGRDVEFYEVEGAGHGSIELHQPTIQNLMLDFFDRLLKS